MNLTSESNAGAQRNSRRAGFAGVRWGRKTLTDLLVYALSILFAVIFVFPTLWMVSSSFKDLGRSIRCRLCGFRNHWLGRITVMR